MVMKIKNLLPLVALSACALSSTATAANWSNTALHINNGSHKNPFTEQKSNTMVRPTSTSAPDATFSSITADKLSVE